MRVGIAILPEHRWWAAEPKWQALETYGFHHGWTMDHLGWRSLVDGPWFGAIPTLTAAAMVTDRIKLGTLVSTPNFRHPVSFARELTAIDDISDGRFVLGVGAGGPGYDTEVFGAPALSPGMRAARFGEFVELLHQVLINEQTTFHGEWYTAEQARSAPGCVGKPRLPFVVAADGPKTMMLAARYGTGWITTGGGWGQVPDLDSWWTAVGTAVGRFDEVLDSIGRPRTQVARFLQLDAAPEYVLSSVEAFRDAVGRATELGFTDVVAPWPRDHGVFAGAEQVLEDVAISVLPELAR